MNNKDIYRSVCDNEDTIPLFSQAWWLDAVAGENWDVVLVERKGTVQACLPYTKNTKMGLVSLSQPSFTQSLGPWIRPSTANYSKQLSQQKDLMQELIVKLPRYDRYKQNWSSNISNWLPFYWKGFRQTTRYTYTLENIKDSEIIQKNFDTNKKRNIRKAEPLVTISYDLSPHDFYLFHSAALLKQGQHIGYSLELFLKLYEAVKNKKSGTIISAADDAGKLHAVVFIIWDSSRAYNLICTTDIDYRKYGASALVFREAIKYASNFVDKFDFEGSMIEGVENSYKQFGAKQEPYFYVSHTPSKFVKIIEFLRELKN